jgi:hypothetical protein
MALKDFRNGINEGSRFTCDFETEAQAREFAAGLPDPSYFAIVPPHPEIDPIFDGWQACFYGPWATQKEAYSFLRPLKRAHGGRHLQAGGTWPGWPGTPSYDLANPHSGGRWFRSRR